LGDAEDGTEGVLIDGTESQSCRIKKKVAEKKKKLPRQSKLFLSSAAPHTRVMITKIYCSLVEKVKTKPNL
jgi:hypothetical protein